MKLRILSALVASLALAGSLYAQQQNGLPWFPSWDGKKTNWVTAVAFKQQIGAANLADVQSINGRLTAAESTIVTLANRITALEQRLNQTQTGGSFPTVACASPDGTARMMVQLSSGQCIAGEVIVVGSSANAVPIAGNAPAIPEWNVYANCEKGWAVPVLERKALWVCGEDRRWRQLAFQNNKPAFLW